MGTIRLLLSTGGDFAAKTLHDELRRSSDSASSWPADTSRTIAALGASGPHFETRRCPEPLRRTRGCPGWEISGSMRPGAVRTQESEGAQSLFRWGRARIQGKQWFKTIPAGWRGVRGRCAGTLRGRGETLHEAECAGVQAISLPCAARTQRVSEVDTATSGPGADVRAVIP